MKIDYDGLTAHQILNANVLTLTDLLIKKGIIDKSEYAAALELQIKEIKAAE